MADFACAQGWWVSDKGMSGSSLRSELRVTGCGVLREGKKEGRVFELWAGRPIGGKLQSRL